MSFLTPVTPNDPCLTCDPITYVKCFKLINMYESYDIAWTNYTILSENDLMTPVTQNDPRLTLDPITSVEGLKLINMYESYGHAV